MAVTIGNSTSAFTTSSSNSAVVNVPAGGASGDIYVVALRWNTSGTITPGTGFTLQSRATETSIGSSINTYVRTYTGTEGATFTFTNSAFASWDITCLIVKGSSGSVIATNAVAVYNGLIPIGNPSNVTTGSVTRTAANQVVITAVGSASSGVTNTATVTNPSGSTTQVTSDNGTGGALSLASKLEASSGSTNYSGSITFKSADSFSGLGAALVFANYVPPVGSLGQWDPTLRVQGWF